jgi:glutamate dehydrogenase/leucine dehydrogenase
VTFLRADPGPGHDLLTPGEACHPTVIGWMSRRAEPGAVLGLPADLGGPPVDLRPAALGVFLLLERLLEERRQPLREQRIAIQGFGRTGRALAEQLYRAGARIVAVSDISGALYREPGLTVPQVTDYAGQHHRLLGCLEGDGITNLDLLEAPCDILVLAAAPRQVNSRVAAKIQAGIVIEIAPHAIYAPAAKVLDEQDRLVIPSLLALGGASLAFFQEWMERARGATLCTFDGQRLIHAWEDGRSQAQHFKVPLRQGLMIAAISKVAAAVRLN